MAIEARSDLALEGISGENWRVGGTEWSQRRVGPFCESRLAIRSEEGERALGKPKGEYLTFECRGLHQLSEGEETQLVRLLGESLRKMAERVSGKRAEGELSILVAGLGNADLTADAIGPRTVSGLTATRHLAQYEKKLYRSLGCASLSAVAPGVLGQTGIETSALLLGAVGCVQPDLLLVVDALAARGCERLGRTVQLSDVGIEPGSGVGNRRRAITRETMGIPVLALGVPTVVSSATLVWDTLSEAGLDAQAPALSRVLREGESFFVSPKECDLLVARASSLLSRAIDLAFVCAR